ncbi:MAG: type I DNA topoisomerase [Candidatus Glassbacteria bacterium]|nr:type I DNA topoisomerase [Candidatus Glassbacteria bacterium]
MGKNLVIVESPAKAKTLERYLGKDYSVKASMGHVIDLPVKELGVDLENEFKPTYQVIRGKSKVISELKKAARDADEIFLAPDPDREGEAIAWHLASVLSKDDKRIHRVMFNEITRNAVLEAMDHPQKLNRSLFEAQQARRILDRLVGYKISPLLWKRVRSGLSAGRVQSVAVRIVCEREEEIRRYQQKEYWSILAGLLSGGKNRFEAKLWTVDGKRVVTRPDEEAGRDDRFWITDQELADSLAVQLRGAGQGRVAEVERKQKKRNPQPPFITSTMQREAAVRFGWPARKTMQVAQGLYEGIELRGEGATGLITYMRTDSARVAESAIGQVRGLIKQEYGDKYLPDRPNRFSKGKKGGKVQDAHEAIRPTGVNRTPDAMKRYLNADQQKLYTLVWSRFVASQMKPAVYDQTTIDIEAAGRFVLRATGSVMKFPGFTRVYTENLEKKGAGNGNGEDRLLPEVEAGEVLGMETIEPRRHFTQPPPRFTESLLIRELESNGIGRPSTYASIMSTITDKGYVQRLKGSLRPTDLGFAVTALLVDRFPGILNVQFTARMENLLDEVEEGRKDWHKLLEEFYGDFEPALENAKKQRGKVVVETDVDCDKCGSKMVIRWSKHGAFLGCSSWPECKNIKQYERGDDGEIRIIEEQATGIECDKCGSPMIKKQGRYGPFLACSNYPACSNIKPLTTGVKCAREGCDGELVQKKTRRGKTFFSCSNYPDCDYATWDRPLAGACPSCGAKSLFQKIFRGGRSGGAYCESCKGKFSMEEIEGGESGGDVAQSA